MAANLRVDQIDTALLVRHVAASPSQILQCLAFRGLGCRLSYPFIKLRRSLKSGGRLWLTVTSLCQLRMVRCGSAEVGVVRVEL